MVTKAHNLNNSLYSTIVVNPANYGQWKHGQVPFSGNSKALDKLMVLTF